TKGLDEYYKLRDKLESSYEERVLELCPGSSHKDEKAVWNSVSSSSFTIVLTTAKQGRFVDVRCKRPEG
ncbi:MAG: hypothetical protein OIF55_11725, partial [Amphritea sp.]|nr:hypothetical protein [Amphritea sp.]